MTMGQPSQQSTGALRAEHEKILASVRAHAERVEKLHEQPTPQQMAIARELLEYVRKQVAPHAVSIARLTAGRLAPGSPA